MKNIKSLALTTTIVIWTILIGFIIRHELTQSKHKVLFDSAFLFKEAMVQDHNRRLKDAGSLYFYDHEISHDWPKEKIVFTTEKGERVQDNIDSIRALPEEEKIKIIRETLLSGRHPINPDSLNNCFQQQLRERSISISTGIRYTEIDNNKAQYSETDTIFFASAYPLEEHKTGIFNEILVQAYVKVPLITLIEKAGAHLFVPLFVWMALVSIYIIYMYKAIKKKRAEAKLTDADRIRVLLQLHTEQSCLYYKGQKIELTPIFVQVLSLFLSKPDFLISKDEISDILWNGKLEKGESNRISQIISRLREFLVIIPELKIETIRGAGYQVVVKK